MSIESEIPTIDMETGDRKRIVLFGMECAFTESFIDSLLASPVAEIAAVVLPRTEMAVQTVEGWRAGLTTSMEHVPIIELAGRSELRSHGFRSTVADLDPELIVVACFPWRLPPSVYGLPSLGSVNVHPSQLPDGRGPEPIFWAFRRNLTVTGVTLHIIDEGLDTGPIIAQRSVEISSDATMITLERDLAHVGADMLNECLRDPPFPLTTWPQPALGGRSAPFPDASDLIVTTSWNAATAARFINAVSPVYGSIEVLVLATGQRLAVAEVLGVDGSTSPAFAARLLEDEAWIQFSNGTLHCRIQTVHHRLAFEI